MDFRDAGGIKEGDNEIQEIWDENDLCVYEKNTVKYFLTANNWTNLNSSTITSNGTQLSKPSDGDSILYNFTDYTDYTLEFNWNPSNNSDKRSIIDFGFNTQKAEQGTFVNFLRIGGDTTDFIEISTCDEGGNITKHYTALREGNSNRFYNIRIVRKGNKVSLWIDGSQYLVYTFPNIWNNIKISKWHNGSVTLKDLKFYYPYKKHYKFKDSSSRRFTVTAQSYGFFRHKLPDLDNFYFSCDIQINEYGSNLYCGLAHASNNYLSDSIGKKGVISSSENSRDFPLICGFNGNYGSGIVTTESSLNCQKGTWYTLEVYKRNDHYITIIKDSKTNTILLKQAGVSSGKPYHFLVMTSIGENNFRYKNLKIFDFSTSNYEFLKFSDTAQSNNINNYNIVTNNLNWFWSSDWKAYWMQVTSWGFGTILTFLNFYESFRIECDVFHNGGLNSNGGPNTQPRIGMYNWETGRGLCLVFSDYNNSNYTGIKVNQQYNNESLGPDFNGISVNMSGNIWYHITLDCLKISDTILYVKAVFAGTVIYEGFVDNILSSDNHNAFGVTHCADTDSITLFKNVEVYNYEFNTSSDNSVIFSPSTADIRSYLLPDSEMNSNVQREPYTLSYDSTNKCTIMNLTHTGSNGAQSFMVIPTNVIADNVKLTCKFKTTGMGNDDFEIVLADKNNNFCTNQSISQRRDIRNWIITGQGRYALQDRKDSSTKSYYDQWDKCANNTVYDFEMTVTTTTINVKFGSVDITYTRDTDNYPLFNEWIIIIGGGAFSRGSASKNIHIYDLKLESLD